MGIDDGNKGVIDLEKQRGQKPKNHFTEIMTREIKELIDSLMVTLGCKDPLLEEKNLPEEERIFLEKIKKEDIISAINFNFGVYLIQNIEKCKSGLFCLNNLSIDNILDLDTYSKYELLEILTDVIFKIFGKDNHFKVEEKHKLGLQLEENGNLVDLEYEFSSDRGCTDTYILIRKKGRDKNLFIISKGGLVALSTVLNAI